MCHTARHIDGAHMACGTGRGVSCVDVTMAWACVSVSALLLLRALEEERRRCLTTEQGLVRLWRVVWGTRSVMLGDGDAASTTMGMGGLSVRSERRRKSFCHACPSVTKMIYLKMITVTIGLIEPN